MTLIAKDLFNDATLHGAEEILRFRKEGERIDPKIEAYDSIRKIPSFKSAVDAGDAIQALKAIWNLPRDGAVGIIRNAACQHLMPHVKPEIGEKMDKRFRRAFGFDG